MPNSFQDRNSGKNGFPSHRRFYGPRPIRLPWRRSACPACLSSQRTLPWRLSHPALAPALGPRPSALPTSALGEPCRVSLKLDLNHSYAPIARMPDFTLKTDPASAPRCAAAERGCQCGGLVRLIFVVQSLEGLFRRGTFTYFLKIWEIPKIWGNSQISKKIGEIGPKRTREIFCASKMRVTALRGTETFFRFFPGGT